MRKADPELQRRRAEEIAAAAVRCFLTRGFHQTSMQNIAAEAGLSMGLLYRYFENKDAIIESAAELDRAESLIRISAVASAKDVAKALESLARAQIEAARAPGYIALASEIAAEASRNKTIRNLVARDEAAIQAALVAALTTQRKKGSIKTTNLAAFAALFFALVDGIAYRADLDPSLDTDAALAIFRPALRSLLP